MIFITGPLYSGKRELAEELFGAFARFAFDVHELAANCEDLEALADELSQYDAVTAAEVGGGVVPLDPKEREARERAGRLSCMLASRADTVLRVFCGIPKVLKGSLR